MNFADIKPFYNTGNQGDTVEWRDLESTLEYLTRQEMSNGNDGTGIHPVGYCDLDPDFQRPYCWTLEDKTKYVEHILKNGTSGRTIYLNRGPWTRWRNRNTGEIAREGYAYYVLVDGKQRLNAVLEFLQNKVPVFDGHYYEDIEGRLPHWCYFHFCWGDLPNRAAVLEWYLALNDTGVAHTDEELDRVAELLEAELAK